MRRSFYFPVILVALLAVILVWFFRPIQPSAQKDHIRNQASLTAMVQVQHLWDEPLMVITSAIPGWTGALRSVPPYLRSFLPPSAEIYLLEREEGEEWLMSIDLGWRSRLFRLMRRTILNQLQYRGFGAVDGDNTLRTPSGENFLVFQDAGTLFLTKGEKTGREIFSQSSANEKGRFPRQYGKEDIVSFTFSNTHGEFTRLVEDVERRMAFLLLPSVGSVKNGRINIRYENSDNIEVDIALTVKEGGDRESVEADISYLMDLIERYLSTLNFGTEISSHNDKDMVSGRMMIHQSSIPGKSNI